MKRGERDGARAPCARMHQGPGSVVGLKEGVGFASKSLFFLKRASNVAVAFLSFY